MAELVREFVNYEPLRSNRWIVKIDGVPEWLIADFKLYNQKYTTNNTKKPKEKMGIKLDVSIRNAISNMVTPFDILECKKIRVSFLDPTGVEVCFYDMVVDVDTFEIAGDYAIDGLLMTECSFWVRSMDTSDSLSKDEDVLNNYIEKRDN